MMQQRTRLGMLLVVLAMVCGCTSSRTYELEKADAAVKVKAVSVRLDEGPVAADAELKKKFSDELMAALKSEPGLKVEAGAPLELRCKFVHNDPGNAAVRVGSNALNLAGSPAYGAGDGAVADEVLAYIERKGGSLVLSALTRGLKNKYGKRDIVNAIETLVLARMMTTRQDAKMGTVLTLSDMGAVK